MSDQDDTPRNPVAATLRAARAQIADPARWCQGHLAVSGAGYPVGACDDRAVAWCSAGAVWRATGYEPPYSDQELTDHDPAYHVIALLTRAAGVTPLSAYNDAPTTTHPDVLALFDRAIAAAESEATP